MKRLICGLMAGVLLMGVLGSNYHAVGIRSGVYLEPLDPTDGIYKGIYPAQGSFLRQFVNCERSLIFQNLVISKQRADNQEKKTDELIRKFNELRVELRIDPNESAPSAPSADNDPNEVK